MFVFRCGYVYIGNGIFIIIFVLLFVNLDCVRYINDEMIKCYDCDFCK